MRYFSNGQRVPHNYGDLRKDGIGRVWVVNRRDSSEILSVCYRFRRYLDIESANAGFAGNPHMLGQLEDDPPGWITTSTWQVRRAATVLKVQRKEHERGLRVPLWFLAGIWWALKDQIGYRNFMGCETVRRWQQDASVRRVIREAKTLLKRERRYAWMAEVVLTHKIGAGGPRDIAAILLKVAMLEGGQ